MVDTFAEKIVMTPKGKTGNSTTIVIERRSVSVAVGDENKDNNNVHVAGGHHEGIVVNKCILKDGDEPSIPEISLQFLVFLVNETTGSHTQESRKLLFWFKPQVPVHERPTLAQEFFKELVSPHKFPRDYVGFIKMIMKLMQNRYPTIRKLEVELRQLEEARELPVRPLSTDDSILGKQVPLTEQKVLELIEAAYPHPVTVEDLAKDSGWEEEGVGRHIDRLQEKSLVKAMEHGTFTRVIQHDQDIQIVKQMPAIVSSKQPTVAIITAQYCEKLAVDAMMDNKETFVRYTTVGTNPSMEGSFPTATTTLVKTTRFGESNVYTLGNVGLHRIVCTKLPTLGYTREAVTSAGNTTTRLLGTFQKVDHVFIVGVGGGVPHYTDFSKHVRLGDVVVSSPVGLHSHAYIHCEKITTDKDGSCTFENKSYNPINRNLQELAAQLKEKFDCEGEAPWSEFMSSALSSLGGQAEHDFLRPPAETDRLYMSIGEKDVIEVAHPQPQDSVDSPPRLSETPRLHLGPIASGRDLSKNVRLREEFAQTTGALAFDFESDSVVQSVVGSCRDSWALVRGTADYRDGTRRGPWQAHAALAAAGVVKAILSNMPDSQE